MEMGWKYIKGAFQVGNNGRQIGYIDGKEQDFPGDPVVGIPCCQFRGQGFDPWSGK